MLNLKSNFVCFHCIFIGAALLIFSLRVVSSFSTFVLKMFSWLNGWPASPTSRFSGKVLLCLDFDEHSVGYCFQWIVLTEHSFQSAIFHSSGLFYWWVSLCDSFQVKWLTKFLWHRFQTSDGVQLGWLEAGIGQTLLMLPGWPQSASLFVINWGTHLSLPLPCLVLAWLTQAHSHSNREY